MGRSLEVTKLIKNCVRGEGDSCILSCSLAIMEGTIILHLTLCGVMVYL
jgi:hypothetical protein